MISRGLTETDRHTGLMAQSERKTDRQTDRNREKVKLPAIEDALRVR